MREKEKERESRNIIKKKQKNNSTTEYIFEISTTTKRELYIYHSKIIIMFILFN